MSSQVSAVSSTTSNTDPATAAAQLPQQTLTQQDFLQLLITQMTSQDPMNPESNTDFAAQMAQFSALSATQSLVGDVSKLNTQQDFSQAAALLGRTVQVQVNGTTTDQGVVTAVQMNSGSPQLLVNGAPYSLSQVLSVAPTTSN